MKNAAGDWLGRTYPKQKKVKGHQGEGWSLGKGCRRRDMKYKYHCRNHRFLLTAHCHQKPLNLSNFSSSESSTWMTPLFHSEIFVFFCYFQFCMLQTSSPHPLTLCGFSGLFPYVPMWRSHMGSLRHFPDIYLGGLAGKILGKCQLTWTFVFSHKAPPEHSWKKDFSAYLKAVIAVWADDSSPSTSKVDSLLLIITKHKKVICG